MKIKEHPAAAALWERLEEVLNAAGEAGIEPSEPVTVEWGDVYALLSLLEADDVHPSAGADGWQCMNCGHDQGITVMVPGEMWSQISPVPEGVGVLCLWCMDRIAAVKGLPPFAGEAHFEGRVIRIGNPAKRAGLVTLDTAVPS